MEDPKTELKALLSRLELLEGAIFAGQIGIGGLAADCSCQNCGCDSRSGDACGCNPNCSCQGYTASRIDEAINTLFGGMRTLDIKEIQTMKELVDKIRPPRK